MDEESRASRGRTGNESYRGWSPGGDCEERDGEERERFVRERADKGELAGTIRTRVMKPTVSRTSCEELKEAQAMVRSAIESPRDCRESKGPSTGPRRESSKDAFCVSNSLMFCYGMDNVLRDQV